MSLFHRRDPEAPRDDLAQDVHGEWLGGILSLTRHLGCRMLVVGCRAALRGAVCLPSVLPSTTTSDSTASGMSSPWRQGGGSEVRVGAGGLRLCPGLASGPSAREAVPVAGAGGWGAGLLCPVEPSGGRGRVVTASAKTWPRSECWTLGNCVS